MKRRGKEPYDYIGAFSSMQDVKYVIRKSDYAPEDYIAAEVGGKRVWRFVASRGRVVSLLAIDKNGDLK